MERSTRIRPAILTRLKGSYLTHSELRWRHLLTCMCAQISVLRNRLWEHSITLDGVWNFAGIWNGHHDISVAWAGRAFFSVLSDPAKLELSKLHVADSGTYVCSVLFHRGDHKNTTSKIIVGSKYCSGAENLRRQKLHNSRSSPLS